MNISEWLRMELAEDGFTHDGVCPSCGAHRGQGHAWNCDNYATEYDDE